MAHRFSKDTHEAAGPSQKGELDPASVEVGQVRQRRARNRPEPADELRAWEVKADKRLFARPYPPNVTMEPAGMDEEHWTSPHSDVGLWWLQLADAFGTRSKSVIGTFMTQIEQLCSDRWWDEATQQWRIDEHQFSAVLAIVASVKPRNEMEAALAAQMVAVHMLQMKVAARALKNEHESRTVANVSRLSRTFTMQMEELRALRGRSRTVRQNIKVSKETHHHQHIHVHREAEENGGQPHAPREGRDGTSPAIADDRCALPSEDEDRKVVPLPRRARKA